MSNNELNILFTELFGIDIEESKFRKFAFKKKFIKILSKLKGKELYNTLSKVVEVLDSKDLSHYKNLKYDLKKYKRVHVNSSYVILFYDDKTKKVYFVDYSHHDKIYKK